jgi:hypothetical protein
MLDAAVSISPRNSPSQGCGKTWQKYCSPCSGNKAVSRAILGVLGCGKNFTFCRTERSVNIGWNAYILGIWACEG